MFEKIREYHTLSKNLYTHKAGGPKEMGEFIKKNPRATLSRLAFSKLKKELYREMKRTDGENSLHSGALIDAIANTRLPEAKRFLELTHASIKPRAATTLQTKIQQVLSDVFPAESLEPD